MINILTCHPEDPRVKSPSKHDFIYMEKTQPKDRNGYHTSCGRSGSHSDTNHILVVCLITETWAYQQTSNMSQWCGTNVNFYHSGYCATSKPPIFPKGVNMSLTFIFTGCCATSKPLTCSKGVKMMSVTFIFTGYCATGKPQYVPKVWNCL